MRLALGLLVVVALLGVTKGAQLRENDDGKGPISSYDDEGKGPISEYGDEGKGPISEYEDEGKGPISEYEDEDDDPSFYDDLEESEMQLMKEYGDNEEDVVDLATFNMSIFPKFEDVDKSQFMDAEDEANLTAGRCCMAFYMPRKPSHCAPIGGRFFYIKTCHKHHFWPAVCHTRWGDVPGFYYRGGCYYEFGRRFRRISNWSWIGMVRGKAYLSRRCNPCNIFGGYQNNYKRPLMLCVVRHHFWLIPGKLDQRANVCWYLNTATRHYYTIASR